MAWVAVDRVIKETERQRLEGPVDRWRSLRERIHEDVCKHGFNAKRRAFVQSYGSEIPDASLLMMPLVGFLPATDPRVIGTVEMIQRELSIDGLIRRYPEGVDGLPSGEGIFFPCSFWLVDCLQAMGRTEEARRQFKRLLRLRNDVGLLAEEYDPKTKRHLGNFPQALSHIALVNSAYNLSLEHGPVTHRCSSHDDPAHLSRDVGTKEP